MSPACGRESKTRSAIAAERKKKSGFVIKSARMSKFLTVFSTYIIFTNETTTSTVTSNSLGRVYK